MDSAPQVVPALSGRFEAPCFSRAKVVFYDGEGRQVERSTQHLFGRLLQPWEYAGLAGAPDDALVEVGTLQGGIYLELCEPLGNGYRASHVAPRLSLGVVLFHEGFHIQRKSLRRQGLGLRVLHRQLCAAKFLGVRRTIAMAGRSPAENGYYTWPRYGFDGPLPSEVRRRLPRGLEHARTVLDLIECESGRQWWKRNGAPLYVSFDLADGSRSWTVFRQYVEQVRVRRRDGT
jgi:hypothetical protein